MATEAYLDERYYREMHDGNLAERLCIQARDSIFADFLRLCAPDPGDTLLDVGVSDVITPAANLLERLYPHPDRLTAVGLGDAFAFRAAFPRVAYRRVAADEPLPFPDDSFSVAASNAVLEHVGSRERQRAFVSELLRVARKVFVTVPLRYFPVEHHTSVPFFHFWDSTFRVACRVLGKSEWANEESLILMNRARLIDTIPKGAKYVIGTTGIALGPFSSNLYAYIER